MSVYDVISYFDYIYAWAYLTGPRGTKIMGLNSYTLVRGREVNRRLFSKEKPGGVAMKEVWIWGNRTAMLANLKSSVSLFSC
jgi:hypothetical protein